MRKLASFIAIAAFSAIMPLFGAIIVTIHQAELGFPISAVFAAFAVVSLWGFLIIWDLYREYVRSEEAVDQLSHELEKIRHSAIRGGWDRRYTPIWEWTDMVQALLRCIKMPTSPAG